MLVRENEAGEVAIHSRGQRLGFRELKASTALSEGRGAAPSPAPHPQNRAPTFQHRSLILGDKATETCALLAFLQHGETTTQGTFLLWIRWGHF